MQPKFFKWGQAKSAAKMVKSTQDAGCLSSSVVDNISGRPGTRGRRSDTTSMTVHPALSFFLRRHWVFGSGFIQARKKRTIALTMENQVEKNMKHEMETGLYMDL